MWFPDYRKITDIEVRKALAFAYPYEDAINAGGNIAGVTRSPGTNIMPPGIPGRVEYNPLDGHDVGETDAATAKQMLKDAGETGYEIKFLYATDDPFSVDVKDTIKAALDGCRLQGDPGRLDHR
ncbi:MAG: hypothetical protein WKF76_00840 [Nocardioidaceae bacterium]